MERMENDPLLPAEQRFHRKTPPTTRDESLNKKENKPNKERFIKNHKDLMFLILFLSIEFIVNTGDALLVPFFPIEAKKKGVSNSMIGVIISVYALSSMCFAPIAGKTIPSLGVKASLLMGCAVEGTCRMLFGFVDIIESKYVYITVCITLRVFMAAGSTYSLTTAMSAFLLYFSNHMTEASTFVEVFAALGFSLAPLFGGTLYDVGGFKLPFMVFGASTACFGLLGFISLPFIVGNKLILKKEKYFGSYLEVLKQPAILLLALFNTMCYITTTFFFPVFSSYLKSVESGLSVSTIGIYFTLFPIAYILMSPAAYYVGRKNMGGRISLIVGLFIISLSYFIFAVPFLFSIKPIMPAILFGIILSGIGLIFLAVPIMPEMKSEKGKLALREDLSTSAILAGIFQFTCFTGAVIGPTLSALLTQYLSFEVTCVILMNLHILALIGYIWFNWYTG